jgi:hypothetical protein
MKKTLIAVCAVLFAAAAVQAEVIADFNNHARIQTYWADGGAYPSTIDYSLGTVIMSKGSTTFGGGSQGSDGSADFTWGQITQFDVGASDYAAWNSATSFTLTLTNGFTSTSANVSIYASTVQLKDAPGNSGSADNIMVDIDGSGAVNRWFQDQTPHQSGGPMTSLGSFTPTADGLLTISDNAALNTLLGGTTFDANTDQIYVHFVNNTSPSDWAPPSGFSGSTITAVPEPATIGMLGLGALCALLIRRMRL